MSGKKNKLVIVGDSAFAEVAHEYFETDSEYQVVGFSVEAAYLYRRELFGLPVVAFETVQESFNPAEHDVFVAVVYTQLNRLRTRLCALAKNKGFRLARYVSKQAVVSRSASIGEHCFIFEGNMIQPFVRISDNVILWSGNHIGHHSVIKENVFVSSHVVISGFAEIGENSFLGVNASISNNVKVAKDCWVGPGITIAKDTKPGELYRPAHAEASKVDTLRFFKLH